MLLFKFPRSSGCIISMRPWNAF